VKVTIDDVANDAGVSIKTVSRVMNNEPSVRDSTRERVLSSVAKLNYRPNAAARSFASKHAFTIACLYDNPNAYYVTDLHRGLLNVLQPANYELLINPAPVNVDIQDLVERLKEQSRVAGVILTSPFSENNDLLKALEGAAISYVKILSSPAGSEPQSNTVYVDDYHGSFMLTKSLIETGHRSIAFIQGNPEHRSTKERLKGYLAALDAHDISVNNDIILSTQYTFHHGEESAIELLSTTALPDAIIAGNDEMAAGVLSACRQQGLDCPKDLSIAGFEDSPFSRQSWPKLSTVHQDNIAIAELAAERLLAINNKRDEEYAALSYEPQVILRNSTNKKA